MGGFVRQALPGPALSFKVLSFAIAWRSSQGGASGGLQFISIDLPIDGLEITTAIPNYEVYNIFFYIAWHFACSSSPQLQYASHLISFLGLKLNINGFTPELSCS